MAGTTGAPRGHDDGGASGLVARVISAADSGASRYRLDGPDLAHAGHLRSLGVLVLGYSGPVLADGSRVESAWAVWPEADDQPGGTTA